MKNSSLEQLDSIVYQWCIQIRSQGLPLSEPMIQVKVMEFHKILNGEPFFDASTE